MVLSNDMINMSNETDHNVPIRTYSNEIRRNILNDTFNVPTAMAHFAFNGSNIVLDKDDHGIFIGSINSYDKNNDKLITENFGNLNGQTQVAANKTFTILCVTADNDEPSTDLQKVSQNDQPDRQLDVDIAEVLSEAPASLVLPVNEIEEYRANEDVLELEEKWKTYMVGFFGSQYRLLFTSLWDT